MIPAEHAVAIAERLLDPARVAAACADRSLPGLQSLGGTALLHARLSHVDKRCEDAAHAHWAMAASSPAAGGVGLFSARGGMAASLIVGTPYLPDPGPQETAVAVATQWLSGRAEVMATDTRERLARAAALSWADYDAITGLAGIGRVLLAAVAQGRHQAEPGLLAALTAMTALIRHDGRRPGWWLPAADHPAARDVPASGRADTGMAHGIAGPLALLTRAAAAGWTVDGQDEAAAAAVAWLHAWRDPGDGRWPPYVSGSELQRSARARAPGRRDAWCYGTPGIASALATHPDGAETAAEAFAALAARPTWDTHGPALCHGTAGVLQSAAGMPELADPAAARISEAADLAEPFALASVGDDPGLLTGAAGVALALADHAGLPDTAPRTRWDALLLLS